SRFRVPAIFRTPPHASKQTSPLASLPELDHPCRHLLRRLAAYVDHVDARKLSHPCQLTPRVVSGPPLHPFHVGAQQILETERFAGGGGRSGCVRTPHLALRARGDHPQYSRVDLL